VPDVLTNHDCYAYRAESVVIVVNVAVQFVQGPGSLVR